MRSWRWYSKGLFVLPVAFLLPLAVGVCTAGRSAARPAAVSYTPERLVRDFGKAVVLVESVEGLRRVSQGTGFLVTHDGYIVTNWHVVEDALALVVTLADGRVYDDAVVIASDTERDTAVIKIGASDLPVAKLAATGKVGLGERIVTIGNPEGLERTVSDGLLSGVRSLKPGYKLYQITAPISHGSSGSPVFNMRGEVIGVASAYLANAQNVNFAIPVEYVRPLIPISAKAQGQREAEKVLIPPSSGRTGTLGQGVRLEPSYAISLARQARSDTWGPCMNLWASSRPNASVVSSMVKDVSHQRRARVLGWKARKVSNTRYLVSYTYVPSGSSERGWYWEVDCRDGSVRPVHNDYALMKRYHLEMPLDAKKKLIHAIVKCLEMNHVKVPKLTGQVDKDLTRLWETDTGAPGDYSLDCVSACGVAPASQRGAKRR